MKMRLIPKDRLVFVARSTLRKYNLTLIKLLMSVGLSPASSRCLVCSLAIATIYCFLSTQLGSTKRAELAAIAHNLMVVA